MFWSAEVGPLQPYCVPRLPVTERERPAAVHHLPDGICQFQISFIVCLRNKENSGRDYICLE